MTFSMPQKILFKHCDPAGIVFYPRYFEIINDAVEAFFDEALNLPFVEMHKTNGVPTVQIETSFKVASRHGDVLEITIVPTRVGGASLDLHVRGVCTGQVRFLSNLTLVHVRKDMSTERWPDNARDLLSSMIQSTPKDVLNVR